jgi:hypothetical protein
MNGPAHTGRLVCLIIQGSEGCLCFCRTAVTLRSRLLATNLFTVTTRWQICCILWIFHETPRTPSFGTKVKKECWSVNDNNSEVYMKVEGRIFFSIFRMCLYSVLIFCLYLRCELRIKGGREQCLRWTNAPLLHLHLSMKRVQ